MNRKIAAGRLGITDQRLYSLEKRGEVPRPPKTRGRLLYTDEHIETVRCLLNNEPTPAIKRGAAMLRELHAKAMRQPRNQFMHTLDQMHRAIERATLGDVWRLQDDPAAKKLPAEAIIGLHRVGVTFGVPMPPVPENIKRWAEDHSA